MKALKITVILLCVGVLSLYIFGGDESFPSDDDAQRVAKSYVKDQLLDPNSARFITERDQVAKVSDSTWEVTGVVKATNKMGLLSPKQYYLRLKYTGRKGGDWSIQYFRFQ